MTDEIRFGRANDYPSQELDLQFRRSAWQSVVNNSLSGVTDANDHGVDDDRE